MDFVTAPGAVSKLLCSPELSLDTSHIFVFGHSYGGATSIYSGSFDTRIAGIIGLDPWLFPMGTDELARKIAKPLLVIKSEYFESQDKDGVLKERNDFLFENNKGTMHNKFQCYFKDTCHLNQTDIPFFMPDVMKTLGQLKRTDNIQHIHGLTTELMLRFLDCYVFAPGSGCKPQNLIEPLKK